MVYSDQDRAEGEFHCDTLCSRQSLTAESLFFKTTFVASNKSYEYSKPLVQHTHNTELKAVISIQLDMVVHDNIRNMNAHDACIELHAKQFPVMLS